MRQSKDEYFNLAPVIAILGWPLAWYIAIKHDPHAWMWLCVLGTCLLVFLIVGNKKKSFTREELEMRDRFSLHISLIGIAPTLLFWSDPSRWPSDVTAQEQASPYPSFIVTVCFCAYITAVHMEPAALVAKENGQKAMQQLKQVYTEKKGAKKGVPEGSLSIAKDQDKQTGDLQLTEDHRGYLKLS